jgi:uncharacterized membrane protein
MELWKLLGDLHPKLVQFPLVLLLSGLLFDLTGLIRHSKRFHWAAMILSAAGTVGLLFAFICGIYAEIWAGRAGVPQDPIEWHEFVANVASWGFVILTAWRLLMNARSRTALSIYVTIGLCYYTLLGLTAYLGGQLVFHYGAAVVGARANTVLSLHDLNTLATRQTDLNLKYSEMMHHIFGWLTLALSGSLLAQAIFPGASKKVRFVGPALLLLGGIFLFFFADLDLYRLTDPRQWGDREVELHKTIAIMLTTIGAFGLFKKPKQVDDPTKPGLRVLPNARMVPTDEQENPGLRGVALKPGLGVMQETGSRPLTAGLGVMEKTVAPPLRPSLAAMKETGSRPIAIMALIGGGLLFTHVHTVAPYANVAAGVYIAHVVMGLTALSIGAARLLQDGLPRHRRALAVVFAVMMTLESILLITYNEGLPWYIGYGRYNRWGPHGGTIAPYGDLRAELNFDNQTQSLSVFMLDRFADQPRAIDAEPVTLLIGQGYQEISVPMQPADHSRTHFTASAPWLKDAPAFSARMLIPMGDHSKMGYFDPWVAPLIAAVPPNELARYQCPMHDGIRSEKPGVCPVCGMDLVPLIAGVRTVLHDEPYGLKLALSPGPNPLQQRLIFTPSKDGQLLHDLPIVHEHPLHVTVLSADLSFFDHVHPLPQADGTLQLDYHFPHSGSFTIFGEFMPRSERGQTFRLPISVAQPDPVPDPPTLQPTPSSEIPIADPPGMTAELVCQPRILTAGTHSMLLFRLCDHGQPVIDLQPYMGAMGHCAIVSEDTESFLHCHPEQVYPTQANSRGGPDIAFHTAFPHPGKYKLWAQFKRNGQVVIADFVVDVKSPILPAKMVNFILNDY